MGKMPNPLFGTPALGDVLMGGQPPVLQRLVHDKYRTSVGGLHDAVSNFAPRDFAQDILDKGVDVSLEGAGRFSIGHEIAKGEAGPYHIARQSIHRNIALIA